MSHVLYDWVMSHMWMGHVEYESVNESCHTYEWVVSHVCHESCTPDGFASCDTPVDRSQVTHTWIWVTWHTWMSNVTRKMLHVARMSASCRTYYSEQSVKMIVPWAYLVVSNSWVHIHEGHLYNYVYMYLHTYVHKYIYWHIHAFAGMHMLKYL